MSSLTVIHGDCLEELRKLPAESVQCCVTSPPYFGLRDYGHPGQIGMEATPAEFVEKIVSVFAEVRRVLKSDGVLFLNLGDSYASHPGQRKPTDAAGPKQRSNAASVMTPSRSGGDSQRASEYGNDDKPTVGCRGSDPSSQNPNGEHTGSWWTNISDTSLRLALEPAAELSVQTRERMESLRAHLPISDSSDLTLIRQFLASSLDRAQNTIRAVERILEALESTPLESSLPPLASCRPSDILSAFLSSLQSFELCAQAFSDTSDEFCRTEYCTAGSASRASELGRRIQCTSAYCLLVEAWLIKHETTPKLKPKDLIGIPWRVAFALQADGWYLRSDIIWSKPNPMPESVTDRPTKAHEYIFLLTKNERYYYDAAAIAEPLAYGSIDRLSQDVDGQEGSDRVPGKTNGKMKAVARASWKGSTFDHGKTGDMMKTRGHKVPYVGKATKDYASGGAQDASATKARIVDRILSGDIVTRNKRTVWTVTTKPFKGAHFATYPTDLIKPCILAGSRVGDMVLDPFGGSGTTGKVALGLGRACTLIELNADYLPLIAQRTNTTAEEFQFHK